MNPIFGRQLLPEDTDRSSFALDGTSPVEIPCAGDGESPQVQVLSCPGATLHISFSLRSKSWIYIWGIVAHSEIPKTDIPEWCAKVAAEEHYDLFKELLGSFVIIIDEPVKKRISFVSDVLGVRPFFFCNRNGCLTFGSNVWPMYQAGLVSGRVDYDAVSSWVAYGYNCTNGSLFSDLKRLPPGTVVVLKDGKHKEIPYAHFGGETSLQSADNMADDLHKIVSSTLSALLANVPRATLALSGGYDSRYLLALAISLSKSDIQCTAVAISEEEDRISRQVADVLKVPLEVIPVSDSEWDLYDEVFHFMPDGFPVSKFVTYCIAKRHPGIPMLNGYMGDSLMRGSQDKILGKYESEWSGNLADILQRRHMFINTSLLRSDIAKRMQMRSRIPMEFAVRKGAEIGKIFGWADFYFRQRFYISNNFLQHLDVTEALLPFYSWSLLSYKMRHDFNLYSPKLYERIFSQYFPKLSNIPRADTLPRLGHQRSKAARCSKLWARNLLLVMCSNKRLGLIDKNWCVPRTLAGIAGFQRFESAIHHLQRLFVLEERANAYGLGLDWEQI